MTINHINYRTKKDLDEYQRRFDAWKLKNSEIGFNAFMLETFGEDWEVEPSGRIAELKACWNKAINDVTEAMMDVGATLEGMSFPVDSMLLEDED